jgi:cation-transporting ATPase E
LAEQVQPPIRGFSAADVAERVRLGQVNRPRRSYWADYRAIVARNLLTLFNAIVVPAAVALFLLGQNSEAFGVSGFAALTTVMGLVQEIRAKWLLDKLTILVETHARAIRDGADREVPAGDVVLGDLIRLSAGETIVADGEVIGSQFLEVDEALLTGESDPVRREVGSRLLSGSFCVAGTGIYRADRVGSAAFAQSTSAEARRYQYAASPLQASINRIIQALTVAALVLCAFYAILYFAGRSDLGDMLKRIAATITAMIPVGLVLMTTIAFTVGAAHMSGRGAVVQRLNAVESMASVDVICTDKTGTLTTNQLQLVRLRMLRKDVVETVVRQKLGAFSWASIDDNNKSIAALRDALGKGPAVELLDQVPFKSQNRYSAARIRGPAGEQVLALGACEALRGYLVPSPDADWEAAWKELLPSGLRILMFAESDRLAPFNGSLEGFPLRPLALAALSDQLRPEAGAVLEALAGQGIAFKILSGDNPDTVRATVAHLHLPLATEAVLSGEELARAADPTILILSRSVFGRVAPHQKVQIVRTLRESGRNVAMIGDGVNDVLPIKQANLGIAMGDGSSASKTVSGLVLQNNNFALLPETLEEGRTIVRNLRRAAKLFLVKNVYSFVLIVGALTVFGLPFPFLPQQVTLLNLLTIGIPAFLITLSRERSTSAARPGFIREVGWFAARTGLIIAAAGLAVLLISDRVLNETEETQRTLLLSTLILLGVTTLLRALTDGETKPLVGDARFRWLALGAVPVYVAAMYFPPTAYFFRLACLDLLHWGLAVAVALPAFFLCKVSDRAVT